MIKRTLFIMTTLMVIIGTITGATIAYFTDGGPVNDAAFTFGTLNIEVTKLADEFQEWIPVNGQDEKIVEWIFRNNGSKKAYIRAKIDAWWLGKNIELGDNESVWADNGNAVFISGDGKGHTARYNQIDINELPVTIPLYAGQKRNDRIAGSIIVDKDGADLIVKYSMIPGWIMRESHLHVSNTIDFPKGLGNYNNTTDPHNPLVVDEFNYLIPATPSMSFDETIYIAAHGVVYPYTNIVEEIIVEDTFTSWHLDSSYWVRDGLYYYYTKPILPEEEISLRFIITLNRLGVSILGGKYHIEFQAEAVQASNDAAGYYGWNTMLFQY